MEQSETLQFIEKRGDIEVYGTSAAGFVNGHSASANSEYSENSSVVFDDSGIIQPRTFTQGGKSYEYIPFGGDDMLPYNIIDKVGENMVMAQNKLFNALTCYGEENKE